MPKFVARDPSKLLNNYATCMRMSNFLFRFKSTTALSVALHPVSGITFLRNFASLPIMNTYHSHLISFHTYHFAIFFITTVTIQHSFSLPLPAQLAFSTNPFPIVLLHPTHRIDFTDFSYFFVFSGMSVLTLQVLCAKLSRFLASF